jgi:integrase
MASVHRRSNSPYWVAWYRNGDGRQMCRTTKEKDKKKALKIAEAYEGAYRTKNVVDYLRSTFNRLARELDPDASVPTVEEYFKTYEEAHSGELKERTMVSYKQRMKQFIDHFGGDKTMDSVKKSHAQAFRGVIAKASSNATANNAVKVMRAIFSCAQDEGVISGNPFTFKKKLSDDSTKKQPFTLAQVKRLMEVADPEWKSIMTFAIFTGQRLGDLVDLTFANIDYNKKEVLFNTEKTNRMMAIPASDALWVHIESLKRGTPKAPIHPRAYELRHRVGIGSISKDFTRLMVTAGLCKEKPNNKKRDNEGDVSREVNPLTFHSFRHSLASWLRDAGVSESLAMEIIGHDSVAVDRGYVHTQPDAMRNALNKIKLA